jgi:hypothetical protein
LNYAPPAPGHNHRILDDVARFQLDVFPAFILPLPVARYFLEERDFRACFITHAKSRQLLSSQRLVL